MFHYCTQVMSTGEYPTLQFVIPFYYLLFNRINDFLEVRDNNEQPRFGILAIHGKPKEIASAVVACRTKLLKYCSMNATEISLPQLICTGRLFFLNIFQLLFTFLHINFVFIVCSIESCIQICLFQEDRLEFV